MRYLTPFLCLIAPLAFADNAQAQDFVNDFENIPDKAWGIALLITAFGGLTSIFYRMGTNPRLLEPHWYAVFTALWMSGMAGVGALIVCLYFSVPHTAMPIVIFLAAYGGISSIKFAYKTALDIVRKIPGAQ